MCGAHVTQPTIIGLNVAIVSLLVACSKVDRNDAIIEQARTHVLALNGLDANRIVAFCDHSFAPGALANALPPTLGIYPTTVSMKADVITFAWWNNSHFTEDQPHPGFELICSRKPVRGASAIAAGLWYRDSPMNTE
jgi:hypothetical protein